MKVRVNVLPSLDRSPLLLLLLIAPRQILEACVDLVVLHTLPMPVQPLPTALQRVRLEHGDERTVLERWRLRLGLAMAWTGRHRRCQSGRRSRRATARSGRGSGGGRLVSDPVSVLDDMRQKCDRFLGSEVVVRSRHGGRDG